MPACEALANYLRCMADMGSAARASNIGQVRGLKIILGKVRAVCIF